MAGYEASRRTVLTVGAGAVVASLLPGRETTVVDATRDASSTAQAAQTAPAAAPAAGPAAPTGRPNILWLVSEDNNPFIGAYGDTLARTPAIDALAAQGVRYQNAFANAPVCAPSRFALITGMYAQSCGPAENMRADGRIPSFLRGFPQLLREAGYFCANHAKTDYNAPIDMAATWNESSS